MARGQRGRIEIGFDVTLDDSSPASGQRSRRRPRRWLRSCRADLKVRRTRTPRAYETGRLAEVRADYLPPGMLHLPNPDAPALAREPRGATRATSDGSVFAGLRQHRP